MTPVRTALLLIQNVKRVVLIWMEEKRYRNLYVKALECQVETLESVVSSLVHIKDLVDKDHANYSPFNKNEESQYQDGEMKANRILSNNSEILLEDKTNISIYEDIAPNAQSCCPLR